MRDTQLAVAVIASVFAVACGRGGAPGPQDDVVVRAPGVVAKADDNGVQVKAPLGIEVKVDKEGVVVKAPGVDVQTNAKGVSVDAPLVTVRTGEAPTK
jgi:hypothetical protein